MTEETTEKNNSKSWNTKQVASIGAASFLIPVAAQFGLNLNNTEEEILESDTQIPILQIVDVEEEKIIWLESPITQKWAYDRISRVWRIQGNLSESLVSQPSIRIGLRSDGVVIWGKDSFDN